MREEINIPDWQKLSPGIQTYFLTLFNQDKADLEDTAILVPLVLNPANSLELLHRHLNTLSTLKVRNRNFPRYSEFTRTGLAKLERFFISQSIELSRAGAVVYVYGSLATDSVRNGDFDVTVASIFNRLPSSTIYSWTIMLTHQWGSAGGHISSVSGVEIRKYCQAVRKNNLSFIKKNASNIEDAFFDSTTVLNGLVIYSPPSNLHFGIRDLLYRETTKNPLLLAHAVHQLSTAIKNYHEHKGR